MSGTGTEEFVYRLIRVNDNSGYGDITTLCTVKPIVMQRTFEDMKEEGKTVGDFTYKYLAHAFAEMALNIAGLYTKVKAEWFDNYLDSHLYLKCLVEVSEDTKREVEELLGDMKVFWK